MHPLGFILLDIPGPVGGGGRTCKNTQGLSWKVLLKVIFVCPTAAFGRPEGMSKESKDMQL